MLAEKSRRHPKYVVVAGPSGSGKSTLTREIARRVEGVVVFHIDRDKKNITDNGFPIALSRDPKELASLDFMRIAYQDMHKRTRVLLREGRLDLITDSTNRSVAAHREVMGIARDVGADLTVVELSAQRRDLQKRVAARGTNHESGVTNIESLTRMLEDFNRFKGIETLKINTSEVSAEEAARIVIAKVWDVQQIVPTSLAEVIKLTFWSQKLRTG